MIPKLKKWADKVVKNKKKLDKMMFEDLMKNILRRLERDGYDKTVEYLTRNCGIESIMVGPTLLRNNSKQIKDKMWSLKRKEGDVDATKN